MSFSAYLVGTWENRRQPVSTILQIINPTLDDLDVMVAFFDSNENPVRLVRSSDSVDPKIGGHGGPLTPNDMWEINILGLQPPLGEQFGKFGVVKIISSQNKEVKEGIVGFQRQVVAVNIPTIPPDPEIALSEAPLAAIPDRAKTLPEVESIWQEEYNKILGLTFP